MGKTKQSLRAAIWVSGLFSFVISCASISHLQLTYRLPGDQGLLAGKRAVLTVEDERTDKQTLGPGARYLFDDTSGAISLSVSKGGGPGIRKGIYQPPALLMKAMEHRMSHQGIEVLPEGMDAPELALLLKAFLVDRTDRTWQMNISYEARIVKGGAILSSQIVSGEAERFELVGTEQAEVVIGELFTDAVNKLDLVKLFREAGL